MAENRIDIVLAGKEEAIAALQKKPAALLRAVRRGMTDTTLSIRARTKATLAAGPHPMSRTGALSRSIISEVTDDGKIVTGVVGSTLPYKTGYAAILEKGGPIPEIVPIRAKALRFVNTHGFGGMSYHATLSAGGTIKQAIAAAKRTHVRTGDQPFIFVKRVRARYQQAYPYLRPSFDAERPLIDSRFRSYLVAVVKGNLNPVAGGEN